MIQPLFFPSITAGSPALDARRDAYRAALGSVTGRLSPDPDAVAAMTRAKAAYIAQVQREWPPVQAFREAAQVADGRALIEMLPRIPAEKALEILKGAEFLHRHDPTPLFDILQALDAHGILDKFMTPRILSYLHHALQEDDAALLAFLLPRFPTVLLPSENMFYFSEAILNCKANCAPLIADWIETWTDPDPETCLLLEQDAPCSDIPCGNRALREALIKIRVEGLTGPPEAPGTISAHTRLRLISPETPLCEILILS